MFKRCAHSLHSKSNIFEWHTQLIELITNHDLTEVNNISIRHAV